MNLRYAALIDLKYSSNLLHGQVLPIVEKDNKAGTRRQTLNGTEQQTKRLLPLLNHVGHPVLRRCRFPGPVRMFVVQPPGSFDFAATAREHMAIPADLADFHSEGVAQLLVGWKPL